MTTTTSPGRLRSRIGWGWILLSSVSIAVFAVTPYLTSSLADMANAEGGLGGYYATQASFVQGVLYAHIVFGGIALLLGPLQFARGLRERSPRVHRMLGRVLVASMLLAAIAGLVLAPVNSGGLVGALGFGSLAILWGAFTVLGFLAIRRRDVATHRRWMIRAFALTYAAVMLRLWIPVLILAQVPFGVDGDQLFPNAYAIVPFLCWVPNLIVAEVIVRRGATRGSVGGRRVAAASA
jgi:uncharacterized membrane protein YozB (DUF420 family)